MPKDHYVSQTYLRNFTNKEGLLIPYYKGKRVVVGKAASPASVCYRDNGNTNTYFSDERVVEGYIDQLEKNWNSNLDKLFRGDVDSTCRSEISAYLAYLRTNTPTAIRQSQERLAGLTGDFAKYLASTGKLTSDEFSEEVNKEGIDAILNGKFKIEVEPEYAHAKNIGILNSLPMAFFAADWFVLKNPWSDFLTSDNPLCINYLKNNPNKPYFFVPLTPKNGLVIIPDKNFRVNGEKDQEVYSGRLQYRVAKFHYRRRLNKNLVRHAEERCFFSQRLDWIEKLVLRNCSWRVVTEVSKLPTENGYINILRDRLVCGVNSPCKSS